MLVVRATTFLNSSSSERDPGQSAGVSLSFLTCCNRNPHDGRDICHKGLGDIDNSTTCSMVDDNLHSGPALGTSFLAYAVEAPEI